MREGQHDRRDGMDPRNGFEIVWKSGNDKNGYYSVVKVPFDQPAELKYTKPIAGIDMVLFPTDSRIVWEVRGIIDPDTMANFGMEVSIPRSKGTPPFVSDADIDTLREYGTVALLDSTHFEVDLLFPVNNMYQFIHNVWQPRILENSNPFYDLGGPKRDFRMLPQKMYVSRRQEEKATMIVQRLHK